MSDINSELVEKYQIMLQRNPQAKIFAPLAEAYRKMGLIDEGIQICLKGLEAHPHFASGHVALGRLYLEKGLLELALDHLTTAAESSPENLLAQGLLGDTLLKLRRPKEALSAFKMLLFLNPHDEKSQKMVRKLESLTSDEYDDDVFAMTKIQEFTHKRDQLEVEVAEPLEPLKSTPNSEQRDLERYLSLADAFIVRNDFEKAQQTIENAEKLHGLTPEITRRLKILKQRFLNENDDPPTSPPTSRESLSLQKKKLLLNDLLHRIESRRRNA